MKTKISIITVVYNAAAVLEETILSVLQQDYPHIEYIIIDGGSTDGSVDIIRKYSDRIAYWVSEPDAGVYDAMNKGIRKATGDWINFMNAGDRFFHPRTLSTVFENNNYKGYDILYGNVIIVSRSGVYLHLEAGKADQLKNCMPFCHQTVFVRTELAKTYLFDTTFKIAADYKFFYTVWKAGKKFCKQSFPLAIYTMDGISSTNSLLEEFAKVNGEKTSLIAKLRSLIIRKIPQWLEKILLYLLKANIITTLEYENARFERLLESSTKKEDDVR